MDTYGKLVAKANAYRWLVINSMMNAIAEMVLMGRAVVVESLALRVVANMASGLGFSLHDLWYMFEEMSWRHLQFAHQAAKAADEAARLTEEAKRLNGELSMCVAKTYAQKRDKERLAMTAKRVSVSARHAVVIAREHEAFSQAASIVCHELYTEILRRAIQDEKRASKPVVKVEPVKPVEVITPTLSVKPITLKLRQKGVTRTRANQPEVRVDGFEGLAKLMELRAD